MDKKGFTLMELLAVIVILAILMLVAIPSVSSYVSNARKQGYVSTARQYVRSAINLINSGKHDVYDLNTTYYIPSKCLPLESGGDSPYGKLTDAYVLVIYDGDTFNYYWESVDSTGTGFKITAADDLNEDRVKVGLNRTIDTKKSVKGRDQVKIMRKDNCQFGDGILTSDIFSELNIIEDASEKYNITHPNKFNYTKIKNNFNIYYKRCPTCDMTTYTDIKNIMRSDGDFFFATANYQDETGLRRSVFYYAVPKVYNNYEQKEETVKSIYHYIAYKHTDSTGTQVIRFLCNKDKTLEGESPCLALSTGRIGYEYFTGDFDPRVGFTDFDESIYIELTNGETIDFGDYWTRTRKYRSLFSYTYTTNKSPTYSLSLIYGAKPLE